MGVFWVWELGLTIFHCGFRSSVRFNQGPRMVGIVEPMANLSLYSLKVENSLESVIFCFIFEKLNDETMCID